MKENDPKKRRAAPTTSEVGTKKIPFFDPSIEKGLPIPAKVVKRGSTKVALIRWPFASMEIGDSVLVPEWAEPSRASAWVDKAKREQQLPETYKIAIRATAEGYRVWRVA